MGVEKNEFKFCKKTEVVYIDTDIMLIGGGYGLLRCSI